MSVFNVEDRIRENEIKKQRQLEDQSQPLWVTKLYVEKPSIVISSCSVLFLICSILLVVCGLFDQSEEDNREWLVWSDPIVEARDLWEVAEEEFKKKSEDDNVGIRSEEIEDWSTIIILECYKDCDNVLTTDRMNVLKNAEKEIKKLKHFEDFCLASPSSTDCSEDSLTSVFDLLPNSGGNGDISNSDLNTIIDEVLNDEDNYTQYSYLFGTQFKSSNKKSPILRSIFNFGGPISINGVRYKNRYDKEKDQEKEFEEFSKDLIDLLDDINDDLDNGLHLLLFSTPSFNILMERNLGMDLLWALASILFVWIYMTFHLQSFFLSSFSMLNILMSFPITLVLVRLICQVDYFSTLHVLVIFIVLGIAADNVFVLQDAWKQTKYHSFLASDLNKRMAVTFKRASKAMLATSSTTSTAFLATGFSSVMPISSFGIFAGILVPVNFVLVVTFYPAILIVHEKYIKKINFCPCIKKLRKTDNQIDQHYTDENSSKNGIQIQLQQMNNNSGSQSDRQQQQKKQANANSSAHQKEAGKIEEFFAGKFNDFVNKFKYPIIAIFLVWTSIAIWRSTQLGPQTEPDKLFPESYTFQRAENYLFDGFIQSGESDQVIEITLVIGLDKLNKDGTKKWDPEFAGTAEYDSSFNLSIENNQTYLLNFCSNLKSNKLVLDRKVTCFMEGLKDYVTGNGNLPQNFPIERTQFLSKLQEYSLTDEGQEYYLQNLMGIFDNRLNYAAINVVSVGEPLASYKDQEPIEKDWQNLVDDFNKNAPQGIKGMQQSSGIWTWMVTQKAFVSQGFSGMFVSLGFAFAVLLIFTHNIFVSFYSILSISGIVVSVVTVMELSGWQMGMVESITIVILIGFSVDYVVHLANHYVESSYPDRHKRMQESLEEIGISIISGAITTLGSGFFLFFAVIAIFGKFAVLIVSTISFSLLYSLFFFSSIMHAIGPQGDFGNILKFLQDRGCKIGTEKQETPQPQGDQKA